MGRAAARAALILVPLIAAAAAAGCGGSDDGSKDLANGKVFDPPAVKSCLRKASFRVEPHETDTGIDFTLRWRSGAENADVAVEPDPGGAESREREWKQLAADAGIDNVDSYYFRYGNILIGYAKIPTKADRARIEGCLR